MRNVVAEPAAEIRGAGVEYVMQRVEANGEAGGARETVLRRKHARGVENQERVREISCAENPDADKQTPEGNWKRLQSMEEGTS